MPGFLDKLYQKSQLQFALVWIGIYCVAQSLANLMSDLIGVNSSVTLVVSAVLTLILYFWIRNKGLMEAYGLCAAKAPAAKFLWYIPLVLMVLHNLWCGVGINLPAVDTVSISVVCFVLVFWRRSSSGAFSSRRWQRMT